MKNNNKGMSLIELIIAVAMLSLIMTAVIGLMSSNTVTFKKQKSDVAIQNVAQESYNRLSEAIMQAKEIEIIGYTLSADPEFTPEAVGKKQTSIVASPVHIKITATEAERSAGITTFDEYKTYIGTSANYTDVYVKELIVKYSVPLERAGLPDAVADTFIDDTGAYKTDITTDDCTAHITFNENVMSILYEYDLMVKPGYTADGTDPENIVFTKCMNYAMTNGDVPVSAAKLQIDAENGSIGIEMSFAQKSSNKQKEDESYPATGMKYDSDGMIKIRNSYVLKPAK